MDQQIQEKLFGINLQFYNQFAYSFSSTRTRIQPGVHQVMKQIKPDTKILDIGCGNGTLARALVDKGFSGFYFGVDLSEGLLLRAEELLGRPKLGIFQFKQVDLANLDWPTSIPSAPFDWLVCFAVLHHLPGNHFRRQTVAQFTEMVTPHSKVAVSVWQWQNSQRLRKRILPWSTVGLHPDDLDSGDVLLDWRAGDSIGLRYVHTFSEDSLAALAHDARFSVKETFYSDGKTGDLALYQVWQLNNQDH